MSEELKEDPSTIELKLREAGEKRSHQQGVVRSFITRLVALLDEGFLSSFQKIEAILPKLSAAKVTFVQLHDKFIAYLEDTGRDTSVYVEKLEDLEHEVHDAYARGHDWLVRAKAQQKSESSLSTASATRAASDNDSDHDSTIRHVGTPSSGFSTSDVRSENSVLRSRLLDSAEEVDDLRTKLDMLAQQVSLLSSTKSHVTSLEEELQRVKDANKKESARQRDVIDRLEAEISGKDRLIQESRRYTFNPGASTSSPIPTSHAPGPRLDGTSGLARSDLSAISNIVAMTNAEAFKELLNQSANHSKQFFSTMNIPQVELQHFDGDLTKYYAFTNRYDELIGDTDASDAVKLSTLLQYCSDDISAQLDCCNHKRSAEGYPLAREMLKDLYGDPYLISQAWIDKITEFGKVKTATDMMRYASSLRSASETLSSLGYLSELECTKSMRVIIEKTPSHVQNKWRAAHREARESGRRAGLGQMIKIVNNCAKEMNDPIYGQDSLSKLHDEVDVKHKKTPVKKKAAVESIKVAQADDVAPPPRAPSRAEPLPPKEPCIICSTTQKVPHLTSRCFIYRDMSGKEKLDLVRKEKLCYLCLGTKHTVANCPSPSYWKCKMPGCLERHHFTLHRGLQAEIDAGKPRSEPVKEVLYMEDDLEMDSVDPYDADEAHADVEYVYKLSTRLRGRFVLPILPVMIEGPKCYIETHVLQDSGATLSMLSKRAMKMLELEPIGLSNIKMRGIFNEKTVRAPVVDVALTGRHDCEKQLAGNVIIMDDMVINTQHVQSMRQLQDYPYIVPLNIQPYDHDHVDMLIGQDNAFLMEPLCKVKGNHLYSPFALKTRLGWTVHGHVSNRLEFWDAFEDIAACDWFTSAPLEDTLRNMWELDRVPDVEPMSPVNRRILKFWDKNITLRDGHWEIPIPFKKEPPELPNNYSQAERSLAQIGRRLQKNPSLKEQYIASMIKNFTSGYAEIAPEIPVQGYEWYNTHHAVISDNRPGKCRIVKNASLLYKNVSLNNSVHQGPNLNSDLREINIRFRTFEIAMTGDVREMYNQVRVPERQRDSLRFLWWKDDEPGNEVIKCRMRTHMFGGRWSGAASIKAMQHTATMYGPEYGDDVIETLTKDFYVDDWLKSVLSTPIGIALIMKLREMLKRTGFQLVKFGSNSPEVLKALPADELAKPYENVALDVDEGIVDKTLGSLWRPGRDVFGFIVKIANRPVTRRGMLSIYSTIYDPMGFVGPVILVAKLIVQQVCHEKMDWDQDVPADQKEKWLRWLDDLPRLEEIAIPRWLGVTLDELHRYRIHVFVDACETGYGANAYLTISDERGVAEKTSLVMSKCKVNPVRQVTIPRLELCAAVLGVKVEAIVRKSLTIPLQQTVFWSDSQIVLFYIKQQSRTFRTFVANRVAMIQEATEPEQWRYVPGCENIADVTSRGTTVDDLLTRHDWLNGPTFLRNVNQWPEQPPKLQPEYELERKRQVEDVKITDVIDESECRFLLPFLNRFSQWPRLIKSVCYLRRMVDFLKSGEVEKKCINTEEFQNSVVWVVRWIQKLFLTETQRETAVFKKLFPQCQDGVYRVGGRLEFTNLTVEERHPMIIPRCAVTDLFLRHTHIRLAHAGVDRTYYEARRCFWVLGGRATVRKALNGCVECQKFTGKPCSQMMAPLPSYKTQEGSTPFETAGVDLFGPVMVRIGRSDHKRWCCMITCAASRASHIEIVPDMSTSAFIDALNRFIARRGRPRRIISDNGTNFVGAVRELSEMVDRWNKKQIRASMREEKIEWRFNTPAASHHGGFWERQNRTARELMMRLVKNQTLSEFALATVMCKVEGMLNSRPLTRLTDNPEDELPLTPNHLLHVSQLQDLRGIHEKNEGLRKKWKQVEFLADEFWRIWTGSYLKNLQVRQKWLEPKDNLQEGEMVLEIKANLYRMQWPLARVMKVFPGKDGLVRSVRIKTVDGEYERPVTKIVRLEID